MNASIESSEFEYDVEINRDNETRITLDNTTTLLHDDEKFLKFASEFEYEIKSSHEMEAIEEADQSSSTDSSVKFPSSKKQCIEVTKDERKVIVRQLQTETKFQSCVMGFIPPSMITSDAKSRVTNGYDFIPPSILKKKSSFLKTVEYIDRKVILCDDLDKAQKTIREYSESECVVCCECRENCLIHSFCRRCLSSHCMKCAKLKFEVMKKVCCEKYEENVLEEFES